jgi:ferredoxin
VCRVEVLSGTFETGCMSAAQVDHRDRARGVALACQLFPRSDLQLRVLGRRPPSCN